MAGYRLHAAPSVEPLTLTEAKNHLRVDHTTDDARITSLIKTAREWCETRQARAFITQTWKLYLDCFPSDGCAIKVPNPPLQSVTSITYVDTDGATQTWDSASYQVDAVATVGRILCAPGEAYPATETGRINAVTITFVCGYGAAATAIPGPTMDAIRLRLGDLYYHPEDSEEGGAKMLPTPAKSLLEQNRIYSFD